MKILKECIRQLEILRDLLDKKYEYQQFDFTHYYEDNSNRITTCNRELLEGDALHYDKIILELQPGTFTFLFNYEGLYAVYQDISEYERKISKDGGSYFSKYLLVYDLDYSFQRDFRYVREVGKLSFYKEVLERLKILCIEFI